MLSRSDQEGSILVEELIGEAPPSLFEARYHALDELEKLPQTGSVSAHSVPFG